MARFNDRRDGEHRREDSAFYGERGQPRGWNHDHPNGPWSPYNGGPRGARVHPPDERRFDARGRDYWRENEEESPRDWSAPDEGISRPSSSDRWEDPRMGMGDQFRFQDEHRHGRAEPPEDWGNEMGLSGNEPSGRSIPRGPDWQTEPHRNESWIARDDRYGSHEHDTGRARDRWSTHAERMREDRGEQYPSHAQQSWQDDHYRGWRAEYPRDDRGHGYDERELRRPYETGTDDRAQRGMRGAHPAGHDERRRSSSGTGLLEPGLREQSRFDEQRGYGEQRLGERRGYGGQRGDREQRRFDDQRGYGEQRRFDEQRGYGERRGYGEQSRFGERRGHGEHSRFDERRGDRDQRGYGEQSRFGERRGYGEQSRFDERRGDREQRGYGEQSRFDQPRGYGEQSRFDQPRGDRTQRRFGERRDRDARDVHRQYADEPGHDIGSFHGDHGRMTQRELSADRRDFRAEQSHELRPDRGEGWHGGETHGSDEYGRGLEQRSPEDRFRPENREWAMRISGRRDRDEGGEHDRDAASERSGARFGERRRDRHD